PPNRDALGVNATDMTITFTGALAHTPIATMTVNGGSLTGDNPSASVATFVNGSTKGFQPYVDGGGAWQIGNISFNGDSAVVGGLAVTSEPVAATATEGFPVTFSSTAYSETP